MHGLHAWLKLWLKPWLAISLIATVAGSVAGRWQLVQLDGLLYDIGITSRPPRPPSEIAIIGLTEKFIQDRHVSLMPRDRIAKLINIISSGRPSVIALDVWLDSRVDSGPGSQDEQLRQALVRARKAGVAMLLNQASVEDDSAGGSSSLPRGLKAHGATIDFFRQAASGVGGVDLIADNDGIYRNMPLSEPTNPSLPMLAGLAHSKRAGRSLPDEAVQRLHTEATPIDFVGPPGVMRITPAEEVLSQPAIAFLLQDKIVFIGATFPRSGDLFSTPYQYQRIAAEVEKQRRMYGVELLAQATSTVLDGVPRRSSQTTNVLMKTAILALIAAALVTALSLCGVGWAVAGLVAGSALVSTMAIISAQNTIPVLGPHYWPPSGVLWSIAIACTLATAYRQTVIARELRLVKEVFGGYVGDEILAQLGGRLPEMGGETWNIAVLFCDIEGFSALAEDMRDDPARLLATLNEHFEPLVKSLKDHGAFVDNYVGDLVMALFGAPVSSGSINTDTTSAVLAAIDFISIVQQRNQLRRKAGERAIEVGIGVHCGPAVVGNLGSRQKMHYTAIGDTVNIASRVESTTRKYEVPLLVTEEVVGACSPQAVPSWEFVAETTVKGRVTPVRLYKPATTSSPSPH